MIRRNSSYYSNKDDNGQHLCIYDNVFAADIENDDTIEDDLVDENDCIFETEYEDELTLDNNDVIMENDYAKYFDKDKTFDKYDDLYQYVATFADQANGSYCQVY